MTPFDPVLHDHEKRLKALEESRRSLEGQLIVMDALERKHAARMEAFDQFLAQQIQYEIEHEQQSQTYQQEHELAMKKFDEK
jgi:hypothetical protein